MKTRTKLVIVMIIAVVVTMTIIMVLSYQQNQRKKISTYKLKHFSFFLERDPITKKIAIYSLGQKKEFHFDSIYSEARLSSSYVGPHFWYNETHNFAIIMARKALSFQETYLRGGGDDSVRNKVELRRVGGYWYNLYLSGVLLDGGGSDYSWRIAYGKDSWLVTRKTMPSGEKVFGLYNDYIRILPCVYKKIRFFNAYEDGFFLEATRDKGNNDYFLIKEHNHQPYLSFLGNGVRQNISDKGDLNDGILIKKSSGGFSYFSYRGERIVDFDSKVNPKDLFSIEDKKNLKVFTGSMPFWSCALVFQKEGKIGMVDYQNKVFFPLGKVGDKIVLESYPTNTFGKEKLLRYRKNGKAILINQQGLQFFPEDISTWDFIRGKDDNWQYITFKREDGSVAKYDTSLKIVSVSPAK